MMGILPGARYSILVDANILNGKQSIDESSGVKFLHKRVEKNGELVINPISEHIKTLRSFMDNNAKAYADYKNLEKLRIFILVTDGIDFLSPKDTLKEIIIQGMVEVAAALDEENPSKRGYRPYGVSFVQLGSNKEATSMFCEFDDNLKQAFITHLENDKGSELCIKALENYEKAADRETYYKKHVDIVDHVQVRSDDDIKDNIKKILWGAIDPKQD